MTNTLAPETEWYAVKQCKITPITVDNTTTTTYGSSVIVPGIKEVTLTPQANVKDLTGDNTLLDRKSKVNNCEVKVSFAKWSFNVYPLFTGGVSVSAGADPNSTWTWSWDFSRGSYFKLEATVDGVDPVNGDMHLVIYKMNITTPPPFGLKEEDFTTFEATGSCYKRLSDGKAVDVVLNQTAVAIS
jgi:hypothetical protein